MGLGPWRHQGGLPRDGPELGCGGKDTPGGPMGQAIGRKAGGGGKRHRLSESGVQSNTQAHQPGCQAEKTREKLAPVTEF